jgi:hypothetical protein
VPRLCLLCRRFPRRRRAPARPRTRVGGNASPVGFSASPAIQCPVLTEIGHRRADKATDQRPRESHARRLSPTKDSRLPRLRGRCQSFHEQLILTIAENQAWRGVGAPGVGARVFMSNWSSRLPKPRHGQTSPFRARGPRGRCQSFHEQLVLAIAETQAWPDQAAR